MKPACLTLAALVTLAEFTGATDYFVNDKTGVTECHNVTLKGPLKLPRYTETLKLYPPIQELPPRLFMHLPSLEVLIVNYTMMEKIDSACLEGLFNLTKLDLYWNQIKEVPPYTLHSCTKLTYLNLGGNDLEAVTKEVFGTLQNLQELILFSNKLTSVPDLQPLSNLARLDLGRNKIKTVPKLAFQGLQSLSWLNLKGNLIDHIEEGAFFHAPSLRFFNLEWNELREIDVADVTQYLGKLEEIRVSANKFSCQVLRKTVEEFLEKGVTVPEGLAEPGPITYHGIFCYPAEEGFEDRTF